MMTLIATQAKTMAQIRISRDGVRKYNVEPGPGHGCNSILTVHYDNGTASSFDLDETPDEIKVKINAR